ncbi:MAG: helix-turn-helix transcriptional regulator [Pseudomonadota bacterium]
MAFKADAAKIKRWREERHWSQEHLAELAGVALRTIQRVENGEKASQETLLALAAAFNVDAMALSVDAAEKAKQAAEHKAAEADARMRLHFYLHLASVAVVVAIFGSIAIIGSDWEILKISVFFVFPLFVHGVSIVILQVTGRHERKFGSRAAE